MNVRRLIAVVILAAGFGLLAFAVWRFVGTEKGGGVRIGAPRSGLNVLLITVDTTRADHIGCLGGDESVTPNIDRLAEQGVVFTQAMAVAPLTLPSHTSMLTGLYPPHHGIRNNGMFSLPGDVETLATEFRKKGYRTGAFVSASILAKKYGLDRDFEVYDDDLSRGRWAGGSMVPTRTGDVTVEAANEWLGKLGGDDRFFCWVHLYDPHQPYTPPPEFARRFPSDPYSAEIAFADAMIGRLLGELQKTGRLDRTLIAVVADHGEALGEHREQTHGVLLHQATLHVPFVLAGPNVTPGLRVERPVSGADVAPTLARLAKVAPPNRKRLDGVDLVALLRKPRPEPIRERVLYAETFLPKFQYGWSPLRAVRRGPWELVMGTRPALYDLDRDPRELVDLAKRDEAMTRDLARALAPFEAGGAGEESAAKIALSPSEVEQLRSLGYLGSEVAPRRNPPDPRDLIGAHVHMERGRQLASRGETEGALRELNAMLGEDPDNVSALLLRAQLLTQLERFADARADLERCLAIDPDNASVYAQLAQLELAAHHPEKALELARIGAGKRGAFERLTVLQARALQALHKRDEAVKLLDEHLAAHPDDPDLLTARAGMLAAAGDTEKAEAMLRKAIAVDALHRQARQLLAALLQKEGRTGEAAEVYEALLRIQPDNADALAAVGKFTLDDPERARPYLEEAVRLQPGRWQPMVNLAVCYVRLGQPEKAESYLRRALAIEPKAVSTRTTLAAVLALQNRHAEAQKILRALIADGHDTAEVRNNLALDLARQGRLDEAERQARKSLERDPKLRDARLTLTSILHAKKRYGEEVTLLKRVLADAPDDVDVMARLGVALEAAGKPAKALPYLEKALETYRGDPRLLLAAGRAEERLGRSDAAMRHFEEAARLCPPGPCRDEAQRAIERLALTLHAAG